MSLALLVRNERQKACAIGVKSLWRRRLGENTVESDLIDSDEGVVTGGAGAREGGEDGGGEMAERKC